LKYFVTGGAGFIGSNFIHLLLQSSEHQVVNFDKLTYAGNLANLEKVSGDPRYTFVRGDICDAKAVREAIAGCDVVVHFAAESHVDRSIYEPSAAVQTNVTGTFVLLQAARELSIGRFVHVSTDEVYGDLYPEGIADETSQLQPNSPYSASKAASDLIVRSYFHTYNFPAIITRASNNYGPYQFPEKFIPLMICNAMQDQPLPMYGDGQQQRDWLHVEDHCRGLLAVAEKGKPGEVYNIGGGDVRRNRDMLTTILSLIGKPESLIKRVTDRPGHDRRYALSSSKMERQLGWRPIHKLESGLADTVRWYQQNPEWIRFVRAGEYMEYYDRYYSRRAESFSKMGVSV
jgi:dTDP-glucose 4,6-dehydratase